MHEMLCASSSMLALLAATIAAFLPYLFRTESDEVKQEKIIAK